MPATARSTAPRRRKSRKVLSKRYSIRKGFQVKGDPNGIGRELDGISKKNPEDVNEVIVQQARNPKSAMHEAFDWDDTSAAHKHRLRQASYLRNAIQAHTIYSDDPEHEVLECPANLVYPARIDVVAPKQAWMPGVVRTALTQQQVMENEDYRAYHLARALIDLDAFHAKYSYLTELAEVFIAIEKVKAVQAKKKKSA